MIHYHKCPQCKGNIRNHYAKLCKKCYNKNRQVDKINIKCLTCGKEFKDYKSYYYKYCSLECAYLYRSIPQYKKFKKYLNTVSDKFLIWFTGFWEGEGCITLRPNKRRYNISVSQNDKNIMITIQKYLKTGKIYISKEKVSKYLHYHFIISNLGETLALCERILPFIKIKKRKREILEVINFNKSKKIRQYV